MPTVNKACAVCAKTSQVSKPHLVCSKCKTTIYCSTTCQTYDWPNHKSDCRAPARTPAGKGPKPPMTNGQYGNYLIRFQIYPGEIEDPAVWRTLSIPANCSFETLHMALQEAFGWASSHMYRFEISKKRDGDLLATIEDDEVIKQDKHDPMIKAASLWFGNTPPAGLKASKTKLYDIFQDAKYKTRPIVYVYDLGDWWEHHFFLLGTVEGTGRIRCMDGGGHPIAEDAGNVQGWMSVLDAYRATKPTQAQLERREWYESMCFNGDPKGLYNGGEHRWDKEAVNQALAGMRIR